jgi:CBS domain-containing protein
MRVNEVLRRKGGSVVTVAPDRSVREVLGLLAEHRIGALVVSVDGVRVDGIVSERDVVRRLHADGDRILDGAVSAIMTVEVHTCGPQDELDELMALMTERRIRHLPVLVDGRLAGIVSIGDVVKHRIAEVEDERDQLTTYIHGRAPRAQPTT